MVLSRYRSLTLDRWTDEGQKGLQQAALGERDHVSDALYTITERYTELNTQVELV